MGSLFVGTSFAKGFSASLRYTYDRNQSPASACIGSFYKETPDDTDQPTYPFLLPTGIWGNSQIIKVNL